MIWNTKRFMWRHSNEYITVAWHERLKCPQFHFLFNSLYKLTKKYITDPWIGEGNPGLNIGLHSANERRRYKVTPSPIGWAQTLN